MTLKAPAFETNRFEYKPLFFRLVRKEDEEQLEGLLSQYQSIQIYDTFESQLIELAKINNPQKQLSKNELDAFIQEYTNGNFEKSGVWVYYPWSQKLVHLLDEEDFIRVRTNRNIYKITPDELTQLRKTKIGVIGLSVGQAIAITIATERICGEMRLADFDTIELSNLNRLSNANVLDLGLPKAIITARRIAELDPYIKVNCWEKGITEQNIDDFIGNASDDKLNILVEECDSFDIKILSRIKAREKGIPVVMDTNDKGMLDVERFDLEPQRPILHGRIIDLEQTNTTEVVNKLKSLTFEEKLKYLSQIIDMENVSEEMKFSLSQMRKTITGWPQLSSSVALGGAMITDTCRRIALRKFNKSGRYFIHFNDLIN